MEFNDLIDKITQGDCVEGMKQIPDNSIDLVVADFPYNISNYGHSLTKVGSKVQVADFGGWDKFTDEEYTTFVLKTSKEFERILKPQSQAYMFFDNHFAGHYTYLIEKETGLRQKCPLILYKQNPIPQIHHKNFRSAFDMCILFTKDLDKKCKTFNFLSQQLMKNVMEYNLEKLTDHPTEKNLNIIKRFVRISSNKDDLILDPFMGSGTTAIACRMLDRHFIGFEISKEYCDIANNRLKGWMSQTHLSNL
jgi:DNA modification methylase